MSVPGWVYKKMAMGEISSEEVEQLEKLAMYMIMPVPKPLGELSDTQLQNRLIANEQAARTMPIVGAVPGAAMGAMIAPKKHRVLGALGGLATGAALSSGVNKLENMSIKKNIAARQQQKTAGFGDFVRTLKANPKSDELDAAFKMYEKETGKSKNTMSQKDILNYVQKHRTKTASVSPMGRAGADAAVADKSNNLHKVMKNVPSKDRDDVLRALRQMKKQAAAPKKETKKDKIKSMQKLEKRRGLYAGAAGVTGAALGSLGSSMLSSKAKRSIPITAGSALAGALAGNKYNLNKQKKLERDLQKKASFSMGQAGALMGAAALAPMAGAAMGSAIGAFSRKSPAQVQQDLQRILEVHPDIGRPEDPRVQMAYQSLVKLNPSYAEDPLIAGPLLKQIVESRMDPMNPGSSSYVDAGIAKNLSEAAKTVSEIRNPGLDTDVASSVANQFMPTARGMI